MKIQQRLLIAFASVIIIVLGMSTIVTYIVTEKTITQQSFAHLESVATIQKHRIVSALSKRHERLSLVTSRTQLRLSLANYLRERDLPSHAKMIKIINDAMRSIDDFSAITITDTQGNVVASTQTQLSGPPIAQHPVYAKALTVSSVNHLELDREGQLVSVMGGPLILDNETIGVMIISASAQDLVDIVRDYSGLGDTGETIIGRHNTLGNALFLTPLRFDPQAAFQRSVNKNQTLVPIVQALAKRETTLSKAVNYRGKAVLAITRYIPSGNLGMVVIKETAEIYGPLKQLQVLLLIIFIVGFFIALLASFLVSRGIAKPIAHLVDVAEDISGGNLARKANTRGSKIEEINLLAKGLDHMTATLIERNKTLESARDDLHASLIERDHAYTKLEDTQASLLKASPVAAPPTDTDDNV